MTAQTAERLFDSQVNDSRTLGSPLTVGLPEGDGTVSLWQSSAVAAAKQPVMGPFNRLVDDALTRLQKQALDRGDEWNLKQIEIDHGLSNGILSKLRHGKRAGVASQTIPSLAAALQVPVEDLLAARRGLTVKLRVVPGQQPKSAGLTPSPAPSSAVVSTVVSDDDTDRIIADAMAGTDLPYAAGAAVRPLVRDRAALIGPNDSPTAIVRAWIETARDILKRGETATPAAIFGELSRFRSNSARRAEEANRKVDQEMAEAGIVPPASPPPSVEKARERREKRRERE
jgi:DNA-binding Xre family transcriptional regulator